MNVSFAPGAWENLGLQYAYSWRFEALPLFRQEKDCIVNSKRSDKPGDYDYMGLLVPGTFGPGARLSVRCSFEDLGAPMLLLSSQEEIDENGILRTLEYYEIVIWKNGLNVWRHHTEGRKTSYYQVLGAAFPLAAEEIHELSMEIGERHLLMEVDGKKLKLFLHDMPASFRLGYTACEGICRLYEMSVHRE